MKSQKIFSIIFIFIVILTVLGLFIFRKIEFKKPDFTKAAQIFKDKIPMSNAAVNSQNITVEITQDELDKLLATLSLNQFQDLKITIRLGEIEFSGEIKKFGLTSTIIANLIPKVNDGKIYLEVEKTTMSGIKIGSSVLNSLVSVANVALDQNINNKVYVEQVFLKDQVMIIQGKVK